MMNRRQSLAISLSTIAGLRARAQKGQSDPLSEFLEKYQPPGFSYIISKDGKITQQKAIGSANLETGEKLTTDHRFRIASVSKPITACAIFKLLEKGQLKLSDTAVGPKGIIRHQQLEDITIHQLLTHTSGGWPNTKNDPMFQEIQLNHQELIEWTFKNILPTEAPGKKYAYSNFGYCLLGRIIERLSGQPYEQFVREQVLKPCGSEQMVIHGGNREVTYYTNRQPDKYPMNVPRMDAHGGWIATPQEMLQFALSVDGFCFQPDILEKESLKKMTTGSTANPSYACGWSVNKQGNYWHGGSLPGLTSLLVRTQSGYCWAACINTRQKGIALALDRLMWDLATRSSS